MNVHYRSAQPETIEKLLTLIEELYALDGHRFDPCKARSAIAGLMENPLYGRAWMIEVDGTLAGYVVVTFGYSIEYHGRDAILDEIYLREPFRGQGIGTQTITFVENECRQLGIHALHLEVMTDNPKARALYRRLGYASRPSLFLHKWL